MSKTKLAVDADTAQLMRDLEQVHQEAVRGEGRINTPEQIKAHKQPVTLRIDPQALAALAPKDQAAA